MRNDNRKDEIGGKKEIWRSEAWRDEMREEKEKWISEDWSSEMERRENIYTWRLTKRNESQEENMKT